MGYFPKLCHNNNLHSSKLYQNQRRDDMALHRRIVYTYTVYILIMLYYFSKLMARHIYYAFALVTLKLIPGNH